ncbi:hypothetical protein [Amycolatopsis australiensis]|uniref:Ornithine cyclodeaminase/mu-crystallin family protein n=1 Tax=Amycolatopsis australiensis TaxID=546364 RepID=A0A1K1RMP5_9PSEU|nr:hypothetical protein [Amycolatopsis australiensis]SFW72967.1 Ornithine cyclodeaminase/mu-crystallin family protein [Amycolatopsis australiensis]
MTTEGERGGPRIPRLCADQIWTAFEAIDLLGVLADELTGAAWDGAGRCRLAPEAGGLEDHVVLHDLHAGISRLLPVPVLRAFRAAAVTTLVARRLLVPGVVLGGVLGAGFAAQVHVAVLARFLPDFSHVTVCTCTGLSSTRILPRLLDQLDLSGIGFSVTDDAHEAVLGANLVVAPPGGGGFAGIGLPARGAVLVNSSGHALAAQVADRVDQIYVDDPARTTRHEYRGAVVAGLGELITARGLRRRADDVLLAEPAGADALDVRLAWEVHRTALERSR